MLVSDIENIIKTLNNILETQEKILQQQETIIKQTTRPKRKRKPPEPETHPPGINLEAWDAYVKYRKDMGFKKLTGGACKKSQEKLVEMGRDAQTQMKIVQQTIDSCGWIGLYPLKNKSHESIQDRALRLAL